MIKVTIRYGESSERFFQRFKRLCAKEGVFKEIKRRRYFEKPSDRRRRRSKEAKRAVLKEAKRAARALKSRRSPRPAGGRNGGGGGRGRS